MFYAELTVLQGRRERKGGAEGHHFFQQKKKKKIPRKIGKQNFCMSITCETLVCSLNKTTSDKTR